MHSLNVIAFFAALLGISSVILTARQHIWCWPIGILSTIFSVYVYFEQALYAESALQIIYLGMAIYGWLAWANKLPQKVVLSVSALTFNQNLMIIALSAAAGLAIGLFFFQFTKSPVSFIDSGLTSFSLAANYLAARKKIDNWIYWIVINLISIALYEYKEMHWFSILFFFYLVIAIRGYFGWRGTLETT